jgi:hypothetical protein
VQLRGVPGQAVVLSRELEQRETSIDSPTTYTSETRTYTVAFVSLALVDAGSQGGRPSPSDPVVRTRVSWRFYRSAHEGQVVAVKRLRNKPDRLVILDDMRFPREDWHWVFIVLGAALLVTFWGEALKGRLSLRRGAGATRRAGGPTHSTPDD